MSVAFSSISCSSSTPLSAHGGRLDQPDHRGERGPVDANDQPTIRILPAIHEIREYTLKNRRAAEGDNWRRDIEHLCDDPQSAQTIILKLTQRSVSPQVMVWMRVDAELHKRLTMAGVEAAAVTEAFSVGQYISRIATLSQLVAFINLMLVDEDAPTIVTIAILKDKLMRCPLARCPKVLREILSVDLDGETVETLLKRYNEIKGKLQYNNIGSVIMSVYETVQSLPNFWPILTAPAHYI
jgi:hypothetical protein